MKTTETYFNLAHEDARVTDLRVSLDDFLFTLEIDDAEKELDHLTTLTVNQEVFTDWIEKTFPRQESLENAAMYWRVDSEDGNKTLWLLDTVSALWKTDRLSSEDVMQFVKEHFTIAALSPSLFCDLTYGEKIEYVRALKAEGINKNWNSWVSQMVAVFDGNRPELIDVPTDLDWHKREINSFAFGEAWYRVKNMYKLRKQAEV